VSYPRVVPEGKVSATPVGGHDVVPTIFHYADVKLPWKMHGRDISPLIQNPEEKSDHSVLLTFTGRIYGSDTRNIFQGPDPHADIPWWVSYRKHQYKYIMNLTKGDIEELYDLDKDPDELRNLALETSYSKALSEMRTAAIEEMKRTDCPFVDKLPVRI